VACPLVLLTIAVGVFAVGLSLLRARELSLRAPLAARPFADVLSTWLREGEVARAEALCARLHPAWGAELASQALGARAQGDDVAFALQESLARARMAGERHLFAIRTLGRIAAPLALGSAIVELGLGFSPSGAETIDAASVQSALDCALRAVATGFTTAVFCQVSVASLQRQARARLDELRIVADALTSQMPRTAR
jgi:biopolymer transport protein ExbB/TolQ